MPSRSNAGRFTKLPRILFLVACAVSPQIPTPLAAQAAAVWTQVPTTGPSARGGHAMAYDSVRGRTVLFGGFIFNASGGVYLADTWEWDGSVWQPQPSAAGPSARTGHKMAYDSQRGRTVLVGGYNGGYFADTWEWDGSAWTQVAPTITARTNHAMAYDSQRGYTVLFGGTGSASGVNEWLGDTWVWNGSAWTSVLNGGPPGPPGRYNAGMAYDSQRGRAVLFGGLGGNFVRHGDTWVWNGSAWTQAASSGPAARYGHAMAFDSARGKTTLFGGYNNSYPGETWEWDGITWVQAATTGPGGRYGQAMAYDSERGCIVLFGGNAITGTVGDTWEWGIPHSPSTATSFGNGCGIPTLTLSPIASAAPTINTTAQASLANIPSSLAFVALGWSRTMVGPFALPFPLVGYGMAGCYMLQSSEAAAQPVTVTGPGTATYSLPLPNWAGLIGLHLYLQGWAVAPGANAGNTIVSNGVEWGIGNS